MLIQLTRTSCCFDLWTVLNLQLSSGGRPTRMQATLAPLKPNRDDACSIRSSRQMKSAFQKTFSPHRMLKSLVFVLASCSFSICFSEPSASFNRPALTTLRQVRTFHADASAKLVTIHVRAVVTYYDTVAPN